MCGEMYIRARRQCLDVRGLRVQVYNREGKRTKKRRKTEETLQRLEAPTWRERKLVGLGDSQARVSCITLNCGYYGIVLYHRVTPLY